MTSMQISQPYKYRRIFSGILAYFPRKKYKPDVLKQARYFYSVWMRHIVLANQSGLNVRPKTIFEIGSGELCGCGVVALLLGADKYYAADLGVFYRMNETLEMLELTNRMLLNRERIPDDSEFPLLKPKLENYDFPSALYDEDYLKNCLDSANILSIEKSIKDINSGRLHFLDSKDFPFENKVDLIDMVISQAVLEYIEDLEPFFEFVLHNMNPKGFMSHQIDLTSHSTSNIWNGHYYYSNLEWYLIKGGYSSFITRRPLSNYKKIILEGGFKIVNEVLVKDETGLSYSDLKKTSFPINEDDLRTRSFFFQASPSI